MTQAKDSSASVDDTLLSAIERICPSWDLISPLAPNEWFDRLTETFNVSGYCRGQDGEVVDFDISDLELQEQIGPSSATDLEKIRNWASRQFYGGIDDLAFAELKALAALSGIAVEVVTVEAGMKFCGTITKGFVRIRSEGGLSGQVACIVPVNEVWETNTDRTFGSMWESPDGEPE
jgi:hypothetical protein